VLIINKGHPTNQDLAVGTGSVRPPRPAKKASEAPALTAGAHLQLHFPYLVGQPTRYPIPIPGRPADQILQVQYLVGQPTRYR
jgi:hypothetical protein